MATREELRLNKKLIAELQKQRQAHMTNADFTRNVETRFATLLLPGSPQCPVKHEYMRVCEQSTDPMARNNSLKIPSIYSLGIPLHRPIIG